MTTLLNSIETLRRTSNRISLGVDDLKHRPLPSLSKLIEVIKLQEQVKPAKALQTPQEYIQQWENYLSGRLNTIEQRAIRFLCWEPVVATDPKFQEYLDTHKVEIRARSIQGLVYSCHRRWSEELAFGSTVRRVRERIEFYSGTKRLIQKWRDNISMLIGLYGPNEFGSLLEKVRQPIDKLCNTWGFDSRTPYVLNAVQCAAHRCRVSLIQDKTCADYLLKVLMLWDGWPEAEFKTEASELILHPFAANDAGFRELLTDFILRDAKNRLGDPRLPGNDRKWLGVSIEARRLVIQWLSRLDIVFFFEHVLPNGKDPHDRKPFWLQYLGRLVQSRPLLCESDRLRLAAVLDRNKDRVVNFGRMRTDNSAFLLDFGNIVAVEFSKVGRVYLYDKGVFEKIIPNFWSNIPFQEQWGLKQPELADASEAHIGHWERRVANVLERYGIRPKCD